MLVLLVALLANRELVLADVGHDHGGHGIGVGSGSGSGCYDCEDDPVCGADGQTYRSSCMAECQDTTVECDGPCPCDDGPCDDEYEELKAGCFNQHHKLIPGCVCAPGCKACGFYESPIDYDDCILCLPNYDFTLMWNTTDYCGEPSPPTGTCTLITDPTSEPSLMPSVPPTVEPTPEPSLMPSVPPTFEPTSMPSLMPSVPPTFEPTSMPSLMPSVPPTFEPTLMPTDLPTAEPTEMPTPEPSTTPTFIPTAEPTSKPTFSPTFEPTSKPTFAPTSEPSSKPTLSPTFEPTDVPTAPPTFEPTMATPPPSPTDTCVAKFQVCKDVDMEERCCPEGQTCFKKTAEQSLCRPKCPGTWKCAQVTAEPTESPTEGAPCDKNARTKAEKEAIVQAEMNSYSHSLIQRTGSAKTKEPVTYVWSKVSESCHQACIDAAGEAKNLYCFDDAMFGATTDITDQMDPFCGVTDELVCIKPPKTQTPSKSTRAPFRRDRDGKCFRTSAAKGRHDCTWTQPFSRRFCGCLAHEHVPKDHLNEQPAERTEDNPVGWNRVSGKSCALFCSHAGLTCSLDKLNDVRGVYDMLDLLALVEDQVDGARCKIWDARFSKAQAPKYRAKDGYCTVAPKAAQPRKASCATLQSGSDFRLCYCE